MQRRAFVSINLGGEGEVAGMLNQQRPAALSSLWASCQLGMTLHDLAQSGQDFLICPNQQLPIASDSIDLVVTNSVAIDQMVFGEPSIQSGEIRRILASSGVWIHDGRLMWSKP